MKTVLVDNSLCAYPLTDNADPDLIFNYIIALRDAGVKYIELDFRTLVKLHRLPEGVFYIFRMVDPMFLRLTEYFDFKYVLLTYTDISKRIKTDIPILFEAPYIEKHMGKALRLVRGRVNGEIAAFRVRSEFEFMTPFEMARLYNDLRVELAPMPIDVCPLNTCKTALDTALKLTAVNVDSLTLTSGLPLRYCSLEEYLLAMLTMFDSLPSECSIQSLGRLSVYRSRIFQTGEQALPKLLNTLDHDIRCLTNADTGQRVNMRVSLKDTEYLNRNFVSALEKMAADENIPADVFENINDAIKQYDGGVFNGDILHGKHKGLIN